jgi:RES domain-containing protein
MAVSRPPRDNRLLDAIDALPGAIFSETCWRVTRQGRDPIQCSAVGGRWDDRTFDVLYTSTKADGAIAELYFQVSRGQPVMPSQVRYHLHELKVSLASCLKLVPLDALQALGLRTAGFGQLSYFEREQEYPRTQEIAEVAYFLGRDGLIVPSARSEHDNLIVFCEPAGPAAVEVIKDHGPIVWEDWRETPLGY